MDFGIVTMFEMQLASIIGQTWSGEGWRSLVSSGRLSKAEAMLEERRRREQQDSLLSCLQFSDKESHRTGALCLSENAAGSLSLNRHLGGKETHEWTYWMN